MKQYMVYNIQNVKEIMLHVVIKLFSALDKRDFPEEGCNYLNYIAWYHL